MAEDNTLLFAITIDTEIDKSPNWKVPNRKSFRSVIDGVPHMLTQIFDRYDARPTYLLSPEVIADEESVSVLKATNDCELGTHLHGDVIEPNRRIHDLHDCNICEMQCSYPREVELGKLRTLSELYSSTFGRAPRSFRAGRWGAGGNTVSCLKELGYMVDSSVSPGVCWDYPEGYVDYRKVGNQPYIPSIDNITRPGDSGILEVPTSIVGSSMRSMFTDSHVVRDNQAMMRFLNRVLPLSWVTPVAHNTPRILHAIDRIVRQNRKKDCVMVCMTFHSVDIIPRASPAVRDEKGQEMMLQRIENALAYARRKGFKFVTLSEAYPFFTREPVLVS